AAVLLLIGLERLVGGGLGLDVGFLTGLAHDRLASAGPMLRRTAELLALGTGLLVIHALPLLARLAFLIWFGAWVWHRGRDGIVVLAAVAALAVWGLAVWEGVGQLFAWYLLSAAGFAVLLWLVRSFRDQHVTPEEPPAAAEPYLHRLFAVRGDARTEGAHATSTAGIVELADVELGKTLHRSETC